jgi:hypothetical protein
LSFAAFIIVGEGDRDFGFIIIEDATISLGWLYTVEFFAAAPEIFVFG